MIARLIFLSVCLLLGAGVIARASRTEHVPPRAAFSEFPQRIAQWRGQNTAPFTKEVLAVLGADDYLSRYYRDGRSVVGLYVGYYQSQRQGDSIHSPLNCLPGAGWQPLSRSYLPITVTDGAGRTSEITVNRYVIEKGLDRQIVLYWYQSHGRVVANEYRSKLYMIFDAARLNRSDAALIRNTSPRIGSAEGAEAAAAANAVAFVKAMYPEMGKFLPS